MSFRSAFQRLALPTTILTALIFSCPAARAIGPHGDAFVGFSTFGFSNHNGAEAALNLRVFHIVGIDGDVSGYKNGDDVAAGRVYLYMAGPRVTVKVFKLHAFAHALGGRIQPSDGTATSGAFLFGLGGGVDLPVISKFNWRVAGDYVHAPSGEATGKRFSTGPVFRF